jgi:hypothetical protein
MHGKRAEYQGEVEARTEAEVFSKACQEHGITEEWRRRRVFVTRPAR